MKICFPFVGDVIGGSHISTLTLIEELKRRGHEPFIVLHQTEGLLSDYLKQRDISYTQAPSVPITSNGFLIKQILMMILAIQPLMRVLKTEEIDVVHANDLRMNYTWLFATKLARRKFIWHQRSASSSKRIGALSIFANAFISISAYCKNLLDAPARKKAHVIYNPVCISSQEMKKSTGYYDYKKQLNIRSEAKIIGFVGNTTPQKNPIEFVDIANEVIKRTDEMAYFVIVGEIRGQYGLKTQEYIYEKGLAGRCFMIGPRFPIAPYLKDFDILVAPALNEGFGRTLVEAMRCKTPVIASHDGGHCEIIEHGRNGFLVHPNDIESYGTQICNILDGRTEKNKIIKQAYHDALTKFSVESHTNEIIKVYEG